MQAPGRTNAVAACGPFLPIPVRTDHNDAGCRIATQHGQYLQAEKRYIK
jgi:hypothetical protein